MNKKYYLCNRNKTLSHDETAIDPSHNSSVWSQRYGSIVGDVYNVRDFGVKCDGKTLDSPECFKS